MNLIVDIGNTSTKYSVYKNNELIYSDLTNKPEEGKVKTLVAQYPHVKNGILSATGQLPDSFVLAFKELVPESLVFDQSTPIPFTSHYTTQNTLGLDRIAGVAGAIQQYPSTNVLIIDAGTAITYDFVNSQGEYLGGNISPGMAIRFKSLNDYTSKLPLLSPANTKSYIGNSTTEAILNGVINGITHEMDGTIAQFQENYNKLTVLLTGGDAHFFDNRLKKTIFVLQNLVSLGLNTILNYNVENN